MKRDDHDDDDDEEEEEEDEEEAYASKLFPFCLIFTYIHSQRPLL